MAKQRYGSHTVTRLTVHIVWVTKYRYHVLKGDVKARCRELIIQICEAEDVTILKGAVSNDHVHMHIEYPPSQSVSNFGQTLQRKNLTNLAARVSQTERTLLGTTFLGDRLWGMEYRKHNGGIGARVFRASSQTRG